MNRIAMTAAATALIFAGLVAHAQEMGVRPAGFAIHRIERQLGLTDGQRESIRAILRNEEPTIANLAQRVREQNQELAALPAFQESQVRAIARQHEKASEDLLVKRVKVSREVMAVLTPEQRLKVERMKAQHQGQVEQRLSELIAQF